MNRESSIEQKTRLNWCLIAQEVVYERNEQTSAPQHLCNLATRTSGLRRQVCRNRTDGSNRLKLGFIMTEY
jgi:hypothetical protein